MQKNWKVSIFYLQKPKETSTMLNFKAGVTSEKGWPENPLRYSLYEYLEHGRQSKAETVAVSGNFRLKLKKGEKLPET